jgi:ubiquinone/menaquinone biosynthesis C-methylase UbiE
MGLGGFSDVDAADDPATLVTQMDSAEGIGGFALCRERAIQALDLAPGARVLDVGCGPGGATLDLARRVLPDGEVVGVDASEAMVVEARQRFDRAALPIHFEIGDAQQLRFETASFDACRTERMLCHVPDPVRAVAEMTRVTKAGGRVVAIDVDMELTAVDFSDVDISRAFVTALAGSVRNGRVGRQLRRVFRGAGLIDVSVTAVLSDLELSVVKIMFGAVPAQVEQAGLVPEGAAERWWKELDAADRVGELYAAVATFVAVGTRS